jgi:hypothetical protein
MGQVFDSLKKGDKVTDRWYGGYGTVVKKYKTVVHVNQFLEPL